MTAVQPIPGAAGATGAGALGVDVWGSQANPAAVTDWGALINTMIAAGQRHFLFQQHVFPFTTPINPTGKSGVHLIGVGGYAHNNGFHVSDASVLLFNGTGDATSWAIGAGPDAFIMSNLYVLYGDGFAGACLKASDGAWGQGARGLVEQCMFAAHRRADPAAYSEPVWSSATTYAAGTMVKYTTAGVTWFYTSLQNANLNHTPPDPRDMSNVWWQPWTYNARAHIDLDEGVGWTLRNVAFNSAQTGLVLTTGGLSDDVMVEDCVFVDCSDHFIYGMTRTGSFKRLVFYGNGTGAIYQPAVFIGIPSSVYFGARWFMASFEDLWVWDLTTTFDGHISKMFSQPPNHNWNISVKRVFVWSPGKLAWEFTGAGSLRMEDVDLGDYGYDAGVLIPITQLNLGTASRPAAWSSVTTYAKGALVEGDGFYVSLQDGNLNNVTPVSGTFNAWWSRVLDLPSKTITLDNVTSGVVQTDYDSGARPISSLADHTVNRIKWARDDSTAFTHALNVEVVPAQRRVKWADFSHGPTLTNQQASITGGGLYGNTAAGFLQLNLTNPTVGRLCTVTFPQSWDAGTGGDDAPNPTGQAAAKGVIVILRESSHPDFTVNGTVDIAKTLTVQAYPKSFAPVSGLISGWELWIATPFTGTFTAEWTYEVKAL